MDVVKIKPSSEDQGEFVIINKCDFDKEKHELLAPVKETAKDKKARLALEKQESDAK